MLKLPADLISVREAAAILGCSESHIRYLMHHRDIEGTQVNPRAYLVSKSSLLKYDKRVSESKMGRPREGRRGARKPISRT